VSVSDREQGISWRSGAEGLPRLFCGGWGEENGEDVLLGGGVGKIGEEGEGGREGWKGVGGVASTVQ